MIKDLMAAGILGTIMIGLYAEARYQIKDNTRDIMNVEKEVQVVKVHQDYNTSYFLDIKKSIEEVKSELKQIKRQR
jgi:hypothetical protein